MVVSVNGAELFYSTRGTGFPCIVPCILGTKPYEQLTPPPLTDLFQFIYVDLRGGGKSTGNPADLTYDVLASDLWIAVDECSHVLKLIAKSVRSTRLIQGDPSPHAA